MSPCSFDGAYQNVVVMFRSTCTHTYKPSEKEILVCTTAGSVGGSNSARRSGGSCLHGWRDSCVGMGAVSWTGDCRRDFQYCHHAYHDAFCRARWHGDIIDEVGGEHAPPSLLLIASACLTKTYISFACDYDCYTNGTAKNRCFLMECNWWRAEREGGHYFNVDSSRKR